MKCPFACGAKATIFAGMDCPHRGPARRRTEGGEDPFGGGVSLFLLVGWFGGGRVLLSAPGAQGRRRRGGSVNAVSTRQKLGAGENTQPKGRAFFVPSFSARLGPSS